MSQVVVQEVREEVPETQSAGLGGRIGTGIAVVAPFVIIVLSAIEGWMKATWLDIGTCVVLYEVIGFGISTGFHRLFTHRSFEAKPALRIFLAVLGTAAVEGPVINWVATHRMHHTYTDKPGDPHSPHDEVGLRGFWHAHIGWMLDGERASHKRYANDLLQEPAIVRVDKLFWPIMLISMFVLPFLIGFVGKGTVSAGLGTLLWGGVLRVFLFHHSTWSVNSVCHLYGKRPYDSGDESTNNRWVAILGHGEGYHNAHHAFPTSARHGLKPWQYDPTWWLICLMKRLGWVTDVKIPSAATLAAKTLQ